MTFSTLRKGLKVGDYSLEQGTGSGACGEVWRASNGGRSVAIKFLNTELLEAPEVDQHIERLRREVEILDRLGDHPNIPALLDHDLDCARPYLVMQHISGPAWNELISSGEILCLPLRKRLELLRSVSQTIRVVHLAGYLHRDIKPSNIQGVEVPHLLDFSVAINKRDVKPNTRRVGTRLYMPSDDGMAADERDDTFALALVAYEVLFGRHAFEHRVGESDPTEELEADGEGNAKPSWKRPGAMADHELPQALRGADLTRLDAIFGRALGVRPLRYRSPVMLIQHLEDAILIPANEPFLDFVPDVAVALSITTDDVDEFTFHEVRNLVQQAAAPSSVDASRGVRGRRLLVIAPVFVAAIAALAVVILGS